MYWFGQLLDIDQLHLLEVVPGAVDDVRLSLLNSEPHGWIVGEDEVNFGVQVLLWFPPETILLHVPDQNC